MAVGRAKLMDEPMSAGGSEDDDDKTESDSDRTGRGGYDSDSASDAAEDLNLTSSDDDDDGNDDEGDDGRGQLKGESTSDDDNEYVAGAADGRDAGYSGDVGGEPNEEDDDESIDLNDDHDINRDDDMDMDSDKDDDDDDDDEDEDDNETKDDDNDEMEEKLNVRQVTTEDFEREAQYEEEEEEIIMKEEQGVRNLFEDDGDDVDDDSDGEAAGNGHASINLITQKESAEEDDASVIDSKDLSFTDELIQSQAGSVDGSVAGHSVVDPEEQKPLALGAHERFEMKAAVLHIISKVSLRERRALKRGDKLEGPPVEDPIAHADEFKRKFRWPVRVINLPKKDFLQDPVEIYNDYELNLANKAVESEHQPDQEVRRNPCQARAKSAFAHVPSPIVEAAAKAAAAQQQQQHASRKRKRSHREEPVLETVSAAALTTVARIGERFADRFLESLISDNAAALQGTNDGYSQRDWTPLPISRKPVANWRFVLENAMKNSSGASNGDRLCPPMRKETLQRIRDRLKSLHSLPWKTADDELFSAVDRLADAPVAEAAELLDDGGILML